MKWPDSDWSQAHVGGNVIRGKATTLQKTSMTDLCYWLLRAAQRQVTRVHYGKVRAISGKKILLWFSRCRANARGRRTVAIRNMTSDPMADLNIEPRYQG